MLLVVGNRLFIIQCIHLRNSEGKSLTSLALELGSELFGRDLSGGRWIDLPSVARISVVDH